MFIDQLSNSITVITLEANGWRGISGTGFFVYCPPYENNIFFVTARHCLLDHSGIFKNDPIIPYTLSGKPNDPIINFVDFLEYSSDSSHNKDDIIVGIIKKNKPKYNLILKERALRLNNQDDIDSLLKQSEANFITTGYPRAYSGIDYDAKTIKAIPKTIRGKFRKVDQQQHYYEIYDTDWTEKSLDGFSGSPILYGTNKNKPILLGILTNKSRFLSINLVTDTIIKYLNGKI